MIWEKDLIDIVERLNERAYDQSGAWVSEYGPPWSISSDGLGAVVKFAGQLVWFSDDDDHGVAEMSPDAVEAWLLGEARKLAGCALLALHEAKETAQ